MLTRSIQKYLAPIQRGETHWTRIQSSKTNTSTSPQGLCPKRLGGQRRVRVTQRNEGMEKNTNQVQQTKFTTYDTLVRRASLSLSLSLSLGCITYSYYFVRADRPSSFTTFSDVQSRCLLQRKFVSAKHSLSIRAQTTTPDPLPSLTGTNPLTTAREYVDGNSGKSPV